MVKNYYKRYQRLVPRNKFNKLGITVIGVGAIGRQISILLSMMGCRNLQLIDFDIIDSENIGSQGYYPNSIGELKTEVLTNFITSQVNPDVIPTFISDKYKTIYDLNDVIFCCVDSLNARKFIWKSLKDKCSLWIDGRMLGENLRILPVDNKEGIDYYEKTFDDQRSVVRGRCTDRTSPYTSYIIAGWMVTQMTHWLRGIPLEKDIVINLTSNEITVE